MRHVIVSTVVLGGVLVVGCSSTEATLAEPVAQIEEAIIGGTISTGDPAVVQLRADYGGSYASCTGTLIAPDVVLTAAHCIDDHPSKVSVWFGTYAEQAKASEWRPAKSWHQHPVWPQQQYINEGHDCAVLVLAQPVAGVAPKPYSKAAMTPSAIGRAARIVGFGHTNGYSQTGGGTKRTLSTTIRNVSGGVVAIGGQGATSCQGDSGGPMFVDENGVETVAGISSYGVQYCVGEGSYSRTELCAAWIDQFVKQGPPPSCTRSCSDRACGPDGCGGTCGTCSTDETCNSAGSCVANPPPPPPSGDACVEHEPNDAFMNAETVCGSGLLAGRLSTASDSDSYTLQIAPGTTYDFRLEAPTSVNIGLYKVSPSGFDYIGAGEDGPNGRRIVRTTSTGGTYYLSVYRYVVGSTPGESWRVAVKLAP